MKALVLFLTLTSSNLADSNIPKGINPSKKFLYEPTSKNEFKCLNSSTVIPYSAVNDDYCDCPCGTDEPGTFACPSGVFYCINSGYEPGYIVSSRVNDGICDCCDGSDEFDGRVSCANICKTLALEKAAEEKKKRDIISAGLAEKEKIIAKAKSWKAEQEKQLESLKSSLIVASELEEKLGEEKRIIDEEERIKRERREERARKRREKQEEEERRLKEEEQKNGRASRTDENVKEDIETHDDQIPDYKNDQNDQIHHEIQDDQIHDNEEYEIQDDQIHDNEENEIQDEDDQIHDQIHDQINHQAHETETHHDNEKQQDTASNQNSKKKGWLSTAKDMVVNLFKPSSSTPSVSIQEEYQKALDQKNSLEKQISAIERYLKLDLGVNLEYYDLLGTEFSLDHSQFTYTFKPFDSVFQGEKGTQSTDIGKWYKWDGNIMIYDNGGYCWNGPTRATKVSVECGAVSELVYVEETSKCQYFMKFLTPAACQPFEGATREEHEHPEL